MKYSGRKAKDFKKGGENTPHLYSTKGKRTQGKHRKIAPKHPGQGRS